MYRWCCQIFRKRATKGTNKVGWPSQEMRTQKIEEHLAHARRSLMMKHQATSAIISWFYVYLSKGTGSSHMTRFADRIHSVVSFSSRLTAFVTRKAQHHLLIGECTIRSQILWNFCMDLWLFVRLQNFMKFK